MVTEDIKEGDIVCAYNNSVDPKYTFAFELRAITKHTMKDGEVVYVVLPVPGSVACTEGTPRGGEKREWYSYNAAISFGIESLFCPSPLVLREYNSLHLI